MCERRITDQQDGQTVIGGLMKSRRSLAGDQVQVEHQKLSSEAEKTVLENSQ